MKSRLSTRIAANSLLAAITIPAGLAAPVALVAQDGRVHHNRVSYSLKVLGTLGGTFSETHGLNNRGVAAGQSTLSGGNRNFCERF